MKNKILILSIVFTSIFTFQFVQYFETQLYSDFDLFMIGYSFCFFLSSIYIFSNSCPKIVFWTTFLVYGTLNNLVDEITKTADKDTVYEYVIFFIVLIMAYKKHRNYARESRCMEGDNSKLR